VAKVKVVVAAAFVYGIVAMVACNAQHERPQTLHAVGALKQVVGRSCGRTLPTTARWPARWMTSASSLVGLRCSVP
jgi:hypothetical protein